MQRSRDESVPLKELASILETDSALTVELLKYVNSSSCGLRTKAKTVRSMFLSRMCSDTTVCDRDRMKIPAFHYEIVT